jgi:hypothetical protein
MLLQIIKSRGFESAVLRGIEVEGVSLDCIILGAEYNQYFFWIGGDRVCYSLN